MVQLIHLRMLEGFIRQISSLGKKSAASPVPVAVQNVPLTDKEILSAGKNVPIIKLVDSIVQQGYLSKASDIHIDPEAEGVRVRMRIDGILHDTIMLSKELHSEIITRLKVLSGLRTDEHQMALDGRFRVIIQDGMPVDVRLSIAPTYYGENAVMRILAKQAEDFTLEKLGLSPMNYERVLRAIRKPYGMILATGPTGSGKTSTLYTIIKTLNKPEVSIVTIEDPIEYSLEGVEQIQVNPRTGLTFADGLRSILRQDPNIVMVGEIRDQETAGIAVNAALTGHLLLSTIHTNDAVTTLPRLTDMKIEPFLIVSTVNVAIGQRLVRRVCQNCKEKYILSPAELKSLSLVISAKLLDGHQEFYRGKGCEQCDGSGYHGRLGIHEVLEMSEAVQDAVIKRLDAGEIQKIAIREGMKTMLEDGFDKALQGMTTIEEILRVTHE